MTWQKVGHIHTLYTHCTHCTHTHTHTHTNTHNTPPHLTASHQPPCTHSRLPTPYLMLHPVAMQRPALPRRRHLRVLQRRRAHGADGRLH